MGDAVVIFKDAVAAIAEKALAVKLHFRQAGMVVPLAAAAVHLHAHGLPAELGAEDAKGGIEIAAVFFGQLLRDAGRGSGGGGSRRDVGDAEVFQCDGDKLAQDVARPRGKAGVAEMAADRP